MRGLVSFLMPVWVSAGPVSKVLDMLADLKTKGEAEKQKETVLCKKYQVWSAGQISATTAELAHAQDAVATKEAEEASAKSHESTQKDKAATAAGYDHDRAAPYAKKNGGRSRFRGF